MAVALSGSIILEGSITGSLLGTASYSSNTEFFDGLDSSVFALTSSLSAFSSSLNGFTSSINTYTASNNSSISNLNGATSSLFAATSSLFTYTASATSRINALDQYTASLNTRSASFACVNATNTFACAQYFSDASNASNFNSTASLYSDGGMRITKDLYVSGTSYFNNITVFGTQSVAYISSSQLNIGTNIITVNTDVPAIRFGGLAVYDSGSTGLTGSILWDSQANHWIYSNPSGSTYSGGMFISGPRSAALGSEQGTTSCALMMGQGGDHITSSAIFHYSNATCFYGQSFISSSGAVCFGGSLTGTSATFNNNSTSNAGFFQINDGTTTLGNSFATVHRNANDGNGRFSLSRWQVQNASGLDQSAFIGTQAVTGASNYNPNLILGISTGASSYATYLTITSTGAATFACNVTATTQGLNSAFNAGAFIAKSNGNTFRYTQVGYDNSCNYGWIQALEQGTAYTNLIINGAGGDVGIGTTSPGARLQVAGCVEANGSLYRAVFGTTVQDADMTGLTGGNASEVQIQASSITRGAYLTLGGGMNFGEAMGGIAFYNSNNVDGKRNRAFIVGGQEGATAGEQGSYLSFGTVANTVSVPSERMRITSAGSVGIGTTCMSAEANLFLGAKSAVEGGQLVLQKGTSCACATHLDNYTDRFRVMAGTDAASASELFSVSMINGNTVAAGNSSAASFSTFSTQTSIPFTTWTTFYTTDAFTGGIYIVQAGLNGASTADWAASAIYYSAANSDMNYLVGPVNGNLVQLRKTGNSIQVYQNGTNPSVTMQFRILKVQ
jgi:hypothetical protein